MEELLYKLGINWKLLIAQAINFTIVLIVLHRFVYKPLLKMLQDRQKKIDQSLKDAEKVEENLKKSKIERENQIALGRKEAEKIIESTNKKADEVKNEKVEEARAESAAVIKEAKEKIKMERGQMIEDVKTEVGELVLLASNKVTKDSIDKTTHQKLINEAISDLKKADIK